MPTAIESDVGSAGYIDITPLPHMLFSMGAANMPWWKALAELVDNSFDAKANRVTITCAGRTVTVIDDGRGMPNIATAIKMGGHDTHGGKCLGRYGVGLKDAWLSSGDRIEIHTVRNGVSSTLDVSVSSIETHNGLWKLPCPVSAKTEAAAGTRIVLHLREGRNRPGQDAWEMLAWAFTPAMLSGKQIVNGSGKTRLPLKPCKLPALSEAVNESFEVCGKQVSISIGIIAEGEAAPSRGPFWVQYEHRNIVDSSIGTKKSNDEHIAGTITLGEGWKLTKNKDDFDDYKEELADAINERIRPLLIKAGAMTEDVESSALTSEIAGMLNAAMGSPRREKRKQTKESTGTVTPAATGRKRRRAKAIDPNKEGSVELPAENRKTGFTLAWYGEEDGHVGKYDYHANRVKLNVAHPFVAALKHDKNKKALYCLAAAILTDHHCNHDGGSRLLCADKEFSPVFSSLTKTIGGAQ